MSKDRFIERQAEVAKAAARLREAVAAPEDTFDGRQNSSPQMGIAP